jgi:hypothetical protein
MYLRRLIAAACACLLPGIALAQSSYIAPDGKNPVLCISRHQNR